MVDSYGKLVGEYTSPMEGTELVWELVWELVDVCYITKIPGKSTAILQSLDNVR